MSGRLDPELPRAERRLAAVLLCGFRERTEKRIQDRDPSPLPLRRIAFHGSEHPFDEWAQVARNERRGTARLEVADLDIAVPASLSRQRRQGVVEEMVVDTVGEPLRHAARLLEEQARARPGARIVSVGSLELRERKLLSTTELDTLGQWSARPVGRRGRAEHEAGRGVP
ncbi:MAG: hypothetical protein U0529_09620 [Thermoanaerobaculia bacterium]